MYTSVHEWNYLEQNVCHYITRSENRSCGKCADLCHGDYVTVYRLVGFITMRECHHVIGSVTHGSYHLAEGSQDTLFVDRSFPFDTVGSESVFCR